MTLSAEASEILANDDAQIAIDDVRLRIMNGDVDYIEDATEMLLEALDDEDVEVDDDSAEELARQLWSECLAASEQWVDDVTDVDRVVEAFEELEERGIAYGIFMDWSDIQPVEPDRGRVLIWVNEWENLSHEEVRDLRIGYTGTGAPDDEVAAELVAALRDAGLSPRGPEDDHVEVPVLWQVHLEGGDDL